LARTINKDCVHDDFIPCPASRPENRASRSTPRRRDAIPLRGGGTGATQNGMVANGVEVGHSVLSPLEVKGGRHERGWKT
jgi:hypothetical protein